MPLDPRIPASVKVGGLTYIVKESVQIIRDGYVGRAVHDELEILLDANRPGDLQVSTLLHEILHAISRQMALDFEEGTISRLEYALFQVLKDNRLAFAPIPEQTKKQSAEPTLCPSCRRPQDDPRCHCAQVAEETKGWVKE